MIAHGISKGSKYSTGSWTWLLGFTTLMKFYTLYLCNEVLWEMEFEGGVKFYFNQSLILWNGYSYLNLLKSLYVCFLFCLSLGKRSTWLLEAKWLKIPQWEKYISESCEAFFTRCRLKGMKNLHSVKRYSQLKDIEFYSEHHTQVYEESCVQQSCSLWFLP